MVKTRPILGIMKLIAYPLASDTNKL